jgi:hypothetical protein
VAAETVASVRLSVKGDEAAAELRKLGQDVSRVQRQAATVGGSFAGIPSGGFANSMLSAPTRGPTPLETLRGAPLFNPNSGFHAAAPNAGMGPVLTNQSLVTPAQMLRAGSAAPALNFPTGTTGLGLVSATGPASWSGAARGFSYDPLSSGPRWSPGLGFGNVPTGAPVAWGAGGFDARAGAMASRVGGWGAAAAGAFSGGAGLPAGMGSTLGRVTGASQLFNTGRGMVTGYGMQLAGLAGAYSALGMVRDNMRSDEQVRSLANTVEFGGTGQKLDVGRFKGRVSEASVRWGVGQDRLVNVARAVYDETGDAALAEEMTGTTATLSRATGRSVEQYGKLAGVLNEKFEIGGGADMQGALAMIEEMGSRGNITVDDMSGTLGAMGANARLAGVTGKEGLRRMLGIANLTEGGTRNPRQGMLAMSSIVQGLQGDADVKAKGLGVDLDAMRKKGASFDDMLTAIVSGSGGDKKKLESVFGGNASYITNELLKKYTEGAAGPGTAQEKARRGADALARALESAGKTTLQWKDVVDKANQAMKTPSGRIDQAEQRMRGALSTDAFANVVDSAAGLVDKYSQVAADGLAYAGRNPRSSLGAFGLGKAAMGALERGNIPGALVLGTGAAVAAYGGWGQDQGDQIAEQSRDVAWGSMVDNKTIGLAYQNGASGYYQRDPSGKMVFKANAGEKERSVLGEARGVAKEIQDYAKLGMLFTPYAAPAAASFLWDEAKFKDRVNASSRGGLGRFSSMGAMLLERETASQAESAARDPWDVVARNVGSTMAGMGGLGHGVLGAAAVRVAGANPKMDAATAMVTGLGQIKDQLTQELRVRVTNMPAQFGPTDGGANGAPTTGQAVTPGTGGRT